MAPPIDSRQVAAVALAALLAFSLVAVTVDVGRTTEQTEEPYDAVVVFRNDDVQAGYEFETMQAVDEVFVEEDVPVSLGVIADGLDKDARTCSYLQELTDDHGDLFEIAAHGDTHEAETEFNGASEFGGQDRAVQDDKLERMTDRIASCTGERPTTFIPPFDTYGRTTVELLPEHGYETASGGDQTRKLAGGVDSDGPASDIDGVFEAENVTHAPQTQAFVADWETHEFHAQDTLEERFEATADDGSVYVQMLHYQTFTEPEDRERLREFIRSIDDYGDVRFATLGELGELVREGEIRYDEADEQWYVTETVEGDREVSVGVDGAGDVGVTVADDIDVDVGLPEAKPAAEVVP